MSIISMDDIVEQIKDIPAFPQSVTKIIELTESPDSTVKELQEEIIKDQNITANILKYANSAYYGLSRTISTIQQAVVVLGFQAIKSIAIASSVGQTMNRELPGYALDKEDLWQQSHTCAIAARLIARKVKYPKPDEAYIAGLLRDIGKVIMDQYLREQLDEVYRLVDEQQMPFMEAEQQVMGFHHGQIGARIAEKWQLPDVLVESIALHHQPELAKVNPKLVAITHLADAVVMMMGLQVGVDGLAYNFSEKAIQLLKLDEKSLEQIMSEVSSR